MAFIPAAPPQMVLSNLAGLGSGNFDFGGSYDLSGLDMSALDPYGHYSGTPNAAMLSNLDAYKAWYNAQNPQGTAVQSYSGGDDNGNGAGAYTEYVTPDFSNFSSSGGGNIIKQEVAGTPGQYWQRQEDGSFSPLTGNSNVSRWFLDNGKSYAGDQTFDRKEWTDALYGYWPGQGGIRNTSSRENSEYTRQMLKQLYPNATQQQLDDAALKAYDKLSDRGMTGWREGNLPTMIARDIANELGGVSTEQEAWLKSLEPQFEARRAQIEKSVNSADDAANQSPMGIKIAAGLLGGMVLGPALGTAFGGGTAGAGTLSGALATGAGNFIGSGLTSAATGGDWLRDGLLSGAAAGLGDLFRGAPTNTGSDYAFSDGASLGTSTPNLDISGASGIPSFTPTLAEIAADGGGGISIDSGIDYDGLFGGNQMGSDLSFNGMPGPVNGEGLSFGGGTTTGLSGEGTGSGLSFGDATLSAPSGQGFNGTIQTNLANAPTATPSPFENGLGTGIPQTTATVAATGLGTLGLESAVPGTGFLASGAPASTSVWDKIVNGASTAGSNFVDNITTGKGALTAAGGLFSLYNGIQNSNALKDAASAATAGSDPFKTERAKYQKLLSDSYTNPLGSAENQGLMQMYQQTARRQAAAAGVRSNPIHQNIGMSTAMLGQLNDQRKTLANLAGAQFDPATGFKTGSDLLSNSLSARNNGYGDALFSLAKLFGDK